jgi:hypothetical protein
MFEKLTELTTYTYVYIATVIIFYVVISNNLSCNFANIFNLLQYNYM